MEEVVTRRSYDEEPPDGALIEFWFIVFGKERSYQGIFRAWGKSKAVYAPGGFKLMDWPPARIPRFRGWILLSEKVYTPPIIFDF